MTTTADDYGTLKAAAEAGDAASQYALAMRLFAGDRAPNAPGHGVRWIMSAAAQDHPRAMQAAAVFAVMGLDAPSDWQRAFDIVERAAQLGDAQCAEMLELLSGRDVAQLFAVPPTKSIMEQPRIAVIEGFIPPAWCDWIVARAREYLGPSFVYGSRGLVNHNTRTNTNAVMCPERSDLIMEAVNARVAAVTGTPVSHQEMAHVLHYEVGQEFKPHFDFINSGGAYGRRDIHLYGQRTHTVLVYLSDDFDGGETHFLHPDWKYRGAKGDAVMFWNLTPEGKGDLTTRHAGLAPTRGEKWLLSKWVHDQTVPSF